MFIVRSERNLIQKAGAGIEPAYTALQAAASPLCHPATVLLYETHAIKLERETRLELATYTLAMFNSTDH